MVDRVLLAVKRFKQRPAECSIAAAASLANFFDSDVDYKEVRELVSKRQRPKGLYTSQQARLLNQLGFEAVTIVTADLNLIDFPWARLSKKGLIRRMKLLRAHYGRQKDKDSWDYVDDMVKWLEDDNCDNNLVIDYEFKKYIKKQLDRGSPVGAAVNWTSLFKFSKGDRRQKDSDIKGIGEDHSIVLRGYDEKGVFVVDSCYKPYTGKWAKYKGGYYKLSWEKFLVNIPAGDLILV
jgi:hypothetical protein